MPAAPCGQGAVEHLGSVGGTGLGRVGAEAVNRWELLKEQAAHGLGRCRILGADGPPDSMQMEGLEGGPQSGPEIRPGGGTRDLADGQIE